MACLKYVSYRFSFAALSLCALSLCVLAQEGQARPWQEDARLAAPSYATESSQGAGSGWTAEIGLGVMTGPEYPGSEEYDVTPLPLINFEWGDFLFVNSYEGLGVNLTDSPDYRFGVGLSPDFGRDDDDGDRLRGMGDVDPTAQLRLFGETRVGLVKLEGDIEHDILSGHEGTLASGGVKFARPFGESLFASIGPELTWASEDYMQSYFGVTPAQSLRSGNARYTPDSGFRDISLNAMAAYRFDKSWSGTLFGGYGRLLDEAADSPVVETGNQFRLGTGLSYRF